MHLSLSGTLLETLADPRFQARVYGIVDCGSLLWHLQNTRTIDVLGTAYYHPVLPLIPPADRDEQLARWLGLGRHLFWRDRFRGFWPPELGFSMDLVPTARATGLRVGDRRQRARETTHPDELGGASLPSAPRARSATTEMIVVVRDRDLSNAQESGMDAGWFIEEVAPAPGTATSRRWSRPPPTATTAAGFATPPTARTSGAASTRTSSTGCAPVESGGIRPAFINDYLDRHGAHGWVTVDPGAWNTGDHHGTGFVQWTGSSAQRDALARVAQLSEAVHAAGNAVGNDDWATGLLEQARWRVLRAETSCNFFWGEAWVQRCHDDLDEAAARLDQALNAAAAVS